MKRKAILSSCDWIAYFYENAQTAARQIKPEMEVAIPDDIRRVVQSSLTAWQLGKTSGGGYLRVAAGQYADEHDDQAFLSAVDFFIREGQRHGKALGEWLDLSGFTRKRSDLGESLFRLCRYAIPSYAVWASVVVMVESMEEIYFTAVRRLVPCPRLKMECEQILRDVGRHVQFQCEHLAVVKHRLPRSLRILLSNMEAAFYGVVCLAVWMGHGKLMRMAGLSLPKFVVAAMRKYRVLRRLSNPDSYEFARQRTRIMFYPLRVRD